MELSENDAISTTSAQATSSNRRQSGRAVRAPQKFVPDVLRKRKRGGENAAGGDVENDEEEEDREEDEESGEDESEEDQVEEVKKPRRKPAASQVNKPAAKKPKVNGASESDAVPAVRLPNRPKKAKKVVVDENAEGLFADVFTSGDTSDEVAAAWLEKYEADNTGSMMELVNFVLRSTGTDIKITEDDINDPDNVTGRLGEIQEEYKDQNVHDYPLTSKDKNYNGFKGTLTNFFKSLILTMHQSSTLYDDIALIENVSLWVTTMTTSFLRPIRHTSTVIALAITTALCSAAKSQTEANANNLRQLEGEKKKTGKSANAARMATFQQKVNDGNTRREVCENTIRDFFDTVFVHRYRDVDPKIRTECVEYLGQWIQILPSLFFDGSYLRYLGWMLSDIAVPARHEVIKQLEKIVKNKANIGGIRHFIERFRPRIVEMAAKDSEVSVRASAVQLLDLIREAGMLEPDDIDVIGKLIFDMEARVRKSVVGFFAENIKDLYESKIEDLGGEDALEDAFTFDEEDYSSPRPGWIKLKCLAEVFMSYDAHGEDSSSESEEVDDDMLIAAVSDSRFSLAAQALYEKIPEIKDWVTLAGYLLFDHSTKVKPKSATAAIETSFRNSFKLDTKEELILLEILDAAVKLSLTQTDDQDKSKKNRKTRTQSQDLQESTARQLAVIIPALLKKFSSNPKTTAVVLRLEQGLNLGVFQDLRQNDTAYSDLLHEIGVQFKGHADQRVLTEASLALLHAKRFEELDEITDENVKALVDDSVDDMRRRFLAHKGPTARGNLSVAHLIDLSNTVARVSKLASITSPILRFEKNVGKPQKNNDRASMVPVDILIEITSRGILVESDPETDELEDQLVSSACQAALFYFMWKTRSLQESISASQAISDSEIDNLRERKEKFVDNLTVVLSSRAGLDDLRLLATGTELDICTLFSTIDTAKKGLVTGTASYDLVNSLNRELAPAIQEELLSIFVAAEKQFAKKAKKSLEAPKDDDAPEDVDSDPEDEEEDDITDVDRKSQALRAEQKLCELTAKLTMAILSGVIDASGPKKGSIRQRIQRNRTRLGPNFKEVVAYLDDAKGKKKKSDKGKSHEAVPAKASAKSAEVVEDDDEEEDPFEDLEPEEGGEEDLRRRELLDDPPESIDDDEEANGDGEARDVEMED